MLRLLNVTLVMVSTQVKQAEPDAVSLQQQLELKGLHPKMMLLGLAAWPGW